MMLAPTMAGSTRARRVRATRGVTLDFTLLWIGVAVCAALFFQGGLEALIGAGIGAMLSAHSAGSSTPRATISGAFAGLFAGALLAGLFHDAIASLVIAAF